MEYNLTQLNKGKVSFKVITHYKYKISHVAIQEKTMDENISTLELLEKYKGESATEVFRDLVQKLNN